MDDAGLQDRRVNVADSAGTPGVDQVQTQPQDDVGPMDGVVVWTLRDGEQASDLPATISADRQEYVMDAASNEGSSSSRVSNITRTSYRRVPRDEGATIDARVDSVDLPETTPLLPASTSRPVAQRDIRMEEANSPQEIVPNVLNGPPDDDEIMADGATTPRAGGVGVPLPELSDSDTPPSSTPQVSQAAATPATSTALLTSLNDLRSNLHHRVETLNLEVERLRRRADELERGITQEEIGTATTAAHTEDFQSRLRAFQESNARLRQLRMLRHQQQQQQQRREESVMDSVSRELETAGRNALARQLWRETQNLQNHVESSGAAQGVVGGGTGGRRELEAAEQAIAASVTASEDDADMELDSARKRGSGCMDIEGGRMWRTERRIADYLALPSTISSRLELSALSTDRSTAAAASVSNIWRDNPTPHEQIVGRRPASRSAVPGRTYSPEELERLRHPARSFGTVGSEARAESLTSRGRRVADSINRFSPLPQSDRENSTAQPQALPSNATSMRLQQQGVNNALTRYRDALTMVRQPTTEADGSRRRGRQDPVPASSREDSLSLPQSPQQQQSTSAIRATVETSSSGASGDDIPVSTDAVDDSSSATPGATLTRRVTLRFPPASLQTSTTAPANAQAATGASSRPTSTSTDITPSQAFAQLSALSRTINALTERLEAARRMVRIPSDSAARTNGTSRTSRRNAANAATPAVPATSSHPPLARRPSYPASHTANHPHHRPRIGPDPIAAVINCDNHNSFDINFDGNIVFRPVAARPPNRELVARCLSMLPGGRDVVPSRWMRLTGDGTSRIRRPPTTAGFWVRWVSGPDIQPTGLRLREMQWNDLPPIMALQFAVSPPEDDPWLRADEVEFYTPRSRLVPHLGPWTHSRVRIAAFETDPPIARWGTSAHVRQTVEACGGLSAGDHLTLNLLERTVEVHRADSARRNRANEFGARVNPVPVPPAPATPTVNTAMEATGSQQETATDEAADDWLNAYEPAISQIRADWRAHYRRQGLGSPPRSGTDTPPEERLDTSDPAGGTAGAAVPGATGSSASNDGRRRNRPAIPGQQMRWSRDFLDADGNLLPPVVANRTPRQRSPLSLDQPLLTTSNADSDGFVRYL